MDCFGLNLKNQKCEVLNYKKCIGAEKCSFYKTHEQFHKDREEAARVYKERTGVNINDFKTKRSYRRVNKK